MTTQPSASFDPTSASRKGLEMRRARAALKAEIAAGEHRLVALFDAAGEPEADAVLAGLRVEWFLRAIPGVGVGKAHRILEELGINPRATLGGLRVRQRAALRTQVQRLHRHYFAHLRGQLVVLVGPTAVGKGTIVAWIVKNHPDFVLSVSATTRPARVGERDGEHYFFVSEREFDRLIADDALLEWATVHKIHRYGTPQGPVEALLDDGKNVILEIDIQGARQVRRKIPRSVSIFIAPPSFEELERRLEARGTETERERRRRLQTAKRELRAQGECDHIVVNDVVHDAGQLVVDLVLAATTRPQS
jgi:guanylate kinase